jgi:TctA family transporter
MLSITIFSFVMGVIAWYTGFGLKRSEKVVMALGIGTRNIAAVLIGVLTIPNVEPNMVAMVVIWTVWTILLSYIIAPIMGKAGDKAVSAT